MAGLYTVVFSAVAVTVQQDLFQVVAPATGVCFVHAFELSQSTEVGDAQEEGLALLLKRGSTTTGSGGSTPTPTPLALGQGASGFAAQANNTTKAVSGTIVTILSTNWNVRNSPFQWIFTPEMRPLIRVSERLTLELATTPGDSITMSGTLWVEELN